MSTMMILIWCKELNGLVRRQLLPWTADTWCTVCGSPWGCFPSWWRGASPSPWTRTPGRGPCHSQLGGHSRVGWCLGGSQTLSERQFPWKKIQRFEKEVASWNLTWMSVERLFCCEMRRIFSSRQQRLKICGRLLSKQHRRRPVHYVIKWIYDNSHLAEPSSNLILFANVAVNVRWASIVVWHLMIITFIMMTMMLISSYSLFVIITITT